MSVIMTKLKALLVEDNEHDALLNDRELEKQGFEVEHRRVDNGVELREALVRGLWDIVLCDYVMPQFDTLDALAAVQESNLDISFIVISGEIG